MKHLKKFNEALDILNNEQITKLCDDNLAYLKDNGFEYEIDCISNIFTLVIEKKVSGDDIPWSEIVVNNKKKEFTWLDIKYDFIPFVELLSNKEFKPYKFKFIEPVDDDIINIQRFYTKEYSLSNILNDKIDDDEIMIRLYVHIKVKQKSRLKKFFGL